MNFTNFFDQIHQYFQSNNGDQVLTTQIGDSLFQSDYCDEVNNVQVLKQLHSKFWSIRSFHLKQIDNGLYRKLKYDKVFKDMIQSGVIELHLNNNNRESLLKDISHAKFTQLRILNLRDNALTSIEPLAWINFSYIEKIYLDFNEIDNVKILAKMKNVTLKCLRLNKNHLNNLKPLNRALLSKYDFSLILESFSHPVLEEDLSFLTKLNAKQFQCLRCVSDQRIFNKRRIKSILNKYPGIDIEPVQQ